MSRDSKENVLPGRRRTGASVEDAGLESMSRPGVDRVSSDGFKSSQIRDPGYGDAQDFFPAK